MCILFPLVCVIVFSIPGEFLLFPFDFSLRELTEKIHYPTAFKLGQYQSVNYF